MFFTSPLMEKRFILTESLPQLPEGSATAGRIFRGEHNVISEAEKEFSPQTYTHYPTLGDNCSHWLVVTTIFPPSKLFSQIDFATWCVVVVGDRKSVPFTFKHPKLVLLTAKDQETLPYTISVPWNHFARKNLGYLYAIHHGAEIIYDTDDDNLLSSNYIPINIFFKETTMYSEARNTHRHLYNPYPDFLPVDATGEPVVAWPRGFPLESITDSSTYGAPINKFRNGSDVSVVQSLANSDPDVDSIYRLTHGVPLFFQSGSIRVSLPPGKFSPFNAQATIFSKRSFWGLVLPTTVHGRVSDIWRSYLVQRIMWELGQRLVFVSPFVTQCRNSHEYLGDFNAEIALFEKCGRLAEILLEWKPSPGNLPSILNEGALLLYERGFILWEDVNLFRAWITDLLSVGYSFPKREIGLSVHPNEVNLKKGNMRKSCEQKLMSPTDIYETKKCFVSGTRFDCGQIFDPVYYSHRYPWIGNPSNPTKTLDSLWSHYLKVGISKGYRGHGRGKIMKIVLMTKDEWPLIKSWVLYHGAIFGNSNLYVIDGSTDRRVKRFLENSKIQGVNIFESSSNLNNILMDVNSIMNDLKNSSDYLIKLDTDEFLVLFNSSGLPVSPRFIRGYLNTLSTTGSILRIGYWMRSRVSESICNRSLSLPETNPSFMKVHPETSTRAGKSFFSAATFHSVDLGSHTGKLISPFDKMKRVVTNLGVAHFHTQCYDMWQGNNLKAALSHEFFKKEDSFEVRKKKLKPHLRGVSLHKAKGYLDHLENPIENRARYYKSNSEVSHFWSGIEDVLKEFHHGETSISCNDASVHYLADNEDVKRSGRSPWEHFVSHGLREGRLWLGEPCDA